MITRGQLLRELTTLLAPHPDAQADALGLLAHATGSTREDLFGHPERSVPFWERLHARHLARRRRAQEPLAYLTGHRDFYGRTFEVNRHTLIPRPDTEQVVHRALPFIDDETTIVDVGTGSGILAITLALATNQPTIGIDLSSNALRVARRNARRHATTIDWRHGSFLQPIDTASVQGQRLVCVANLPYLSKSMHAQCAPETLLYEPTMALVSDHNDGLDLYRHLIVSLNEKRHLLPEDRVLVIEIDPRQALAATDMLTHAFPNATVTLHADDAGHPRVLTCAGC